MATSVSTAMNGVSPYSTSTVLALPSSAGRFARVAVPVEALHDELGRLSNAWHEVRTVADDTHGRQ
jgi:hypothetical protein